MTTDRELEYAATRISLKLRKLGDDLPKAVAMGVYALGAEVLRKAQRLVPVDTGRLRASAYITNPVRVTGRLWQVTIGYGTKYAMFVHEGTSRMEGRKWLEKALNSLTPGEAARVIENVLDGFAAGEFKNVRAPATGFKKGPTDGDS